MGVRGLMARVCGRAGVCRWLGSEERRVAQTRSLAGTTSTLEALACGGRLLAERRSLPPSLRPLPPVVNQLGAPVHPPSPSFTHFLHPQRLPTSRGHPPSQARIHGLLESSCAYQHKRTAVGKVVSARGSKLEHTTGGRVTFFFTAHEKNVPNVIAFRTSA